VYWDSYYNSRPYSAVSAKAVLFYDAFDGRKKTRRC
jgi:hypothetical protein